MKGYIITYNGKYNSLNLVVGKTYEFVGEIIDNIQGFGYYEKPDDLLISHEYKKDKTVIFEIEILGIVKNFGITSSTNKFTVVKEINPIEYNNIFKDYIFDGKFNITVHKSEHKIYEYDENDNLIFIKKCGDIVSTYEYNENGDLIHYKGFGKYEQWYEYDDNHNLTHFKDSYVTEEWYEYDEKNNMIHSKISPNTVETWNTFDDNNNLILQKDSLGVEKYGQYDTKGNIVNYKTTNGYEFSRTYDEDGNLLSHEENKEKFNFKNIIS
jgi:YD repeat-containing protein